MDTYNQHKQKLYDRSEYWAIVNWNSSHPAEERKPVEPWCFGLSDWCHDEQGHLCTPEYLFGLNPERGAYVRPEGYAGIDPDARKKQEYVFDPEWDNLESGISEQVNRGIRNDYWRDYGMWNGEDNHWNM